MALDIVDRVLRQSIKNTEAKMIGLCKGFE